MIMNRTRSALENFLREGSSMWTLGNRASIDEEYEEMSRSPSGRRKWFSELSPTANVVIGRCSRILDVPMDELKQNFDSEASSSLKQSSCYARNFLEYCCFRVLALSSHVTGRLGDSHFCRLTFDMMLAWEAPAAASQPLLKIDDEATVGKDAFSRIATTVPAIADVVTTDDLFDVLASSTNGRLTYSVYAKYLAGLERSIRKMKSQSESSRLSSIRFPRGERVLEIDGTITTQPVLHHVGMSAWPVSAGRLTLTDHAFYFEPFRVASYDKARVYDLSEDLKQVIRPELTGPWGTRLFDKAVLYKSMKLPEPVVLEFPELSGHSRRDYWLAITREVLYVHKFIQAFSIQGVEKDEVLSKSILSILRLQALQGLMATKRLPYEGLLMFNLADKLPGGDLILETYSAMLASRKMERSSSGTSNDIYSASALSMLSNLGVVLGMEVKSTEEAGLPVGEIVVGQMSPLERAVKESRSTFKKLEIAEATVAGAKVEGVDTNLAVMKALVLPVCEIVEYAHFLAAWDDPLKSLAFCSIVSYIICRGWLGYGFALGLLLAATFMLLNRFCIDGKFAREVKVKAPPLMNTMEQLLAVQNAIARVEELVQHGNVILLRLRALFLAIFPQATDKLVMCMLLMAMACIFLPSRYIVLLIFLEAFTRYSPPRRISTERWTRRLKEWWFSVPAAPVLLEGAKEEKKMR